MAENNIIWEEVPQYIQKAHIDTFLKIVDDALCYGYTFRISNGKIEYTDQFVNNLFTI